MLVIRLARQGRTKYPVYRLVAADKRRDRHHYGPQCCEILRHDGRAQRRSDP